MASESLTVKVVTSPNCRSRWTSFFTCPALMVSRLVPMFPICRSTSRCAPWPRATIMITAATPMEIPVSARKVRSLLEAREFPDNFKPR